MLRASEYASSRPGFPALAVFAALAAALVFASPAPAATLQPAFDQSLIGTGGYTRAWGVAVADFTGDGVDDIAAGDTYGDVRIWRGTGTGFTPPAVVAINAAYHNAYGLAAADFNGDGHQDLAMGSTADGANDGVVYLYLGNGNGSFQSTGFPQLGLVIGDVGTNVTAVAAADVDGDADVDVVAGDITVSPNGTADVVLYRNLGNDGSGHPLWAAETIIAAANVAAAPEAPPYFPPTTSTLAGYGLAFGDVDGDADQDLFVTDRAGYVYVWGNGGAGTFAPIRFDNITTGTRPYAFAQVGGFQFLSIAAGDLNGDGTCDFAVGTTLDGLTTDGKVAVYLNEGMSGSEPLFSGAGYVGGAGTDARGLAVGSANPTTDAYDDIVFGNAEGALWLLATDRLDTDSDGIVDRHDNLPAIANFPTIDLDGNSALNRADQIDLDGDGVGSVMVAGALQGDPDADGDGVPNGVDNLPFVPNSDQRDLDLDGVGEVDGPWPLCTLGDPLDDRDPDLDGIPSGPFDPAMEPRYRAAKQKLMTGDTPVIMRIDALGRLWQAEFTQTLADSIYLDPISWALKYPDNWNGVYGSGATPPPGLEGGKELPVSVMLIPKMLWTDPTVVAYLNDRLPYAGFELGQHGTYHVAIQPSGPDSELNGFNPLEMYVYMRVGQDTMLGAYDRTGPSDYLSAVAGDPAIDWSGASQPLFTFAPPYDEFDVAAAEACARLGYGAFTSDIWVEGLPRTLMADYSDEFDPYGALHAAANFMPWGTLADIPWWAYEPAHANYEEYIESHIVEGECNVILIEEVNFSGKSGGAVDNTIDAEKWANFQTMLDVVKGYPGVVPMTAGEYAMARAYDNAPLLANPDQADLDRDGVGDVAQTPIAVDDFYGTPEDTPLTVASPGVLGNDTEPDSQLMTATVETAPSHGTVILSSDGGFTYDPDTDFHGTDEFTYTANDGMFISAPATVTVEVAPVNDPPTISVDPSEQTVQYSDAVSEIVVSAGDVDGNDVFISDDGLPDSLAYEWMISSAIAPEGASTRAGISGRVFEPVGDYGIEFTATDDDAETGSAIGTVTVVAEDADVAFDADNPAAVPVVSAGGSSGPISLALIVSEPDDGAPGDITLAEVSVRLVPIGAGSPVAGVVTGPGASGGVTASFDSVPPNTYVVEVTVGGDYFVGSDEDVLAVYDPTASASSGGGWFLWPGTADKTNFAFNGSIARKGQPRGGFVAIRHTPAGGYRVKANAITSYSSGTAGPRSASYGLATLRGKCTYSEPGWEVAEGNYSFILYVEDHGDPGVADRAWLQVRDRAGELVATMSLPAPATSQALTLGGGNISAPHTRAK